MPFLPPGVPHDILADIDWERMMDGGPIGPAPHTRAINSEHSFTITGTFTSSEGIEYKEGMEGWFLEEEKMFNDGQIMAKIYIKGVKETPGERDKWVPKSIVKLNPKEKFPGGKAAVGSSRGK